MGNGKSSHKGYRGSAAGVRLLAFEALMRPIFYQNRLQTSHILQTQQIAYSFAMLKAALIQDLVVLRLYFPDVFLPIYHCFVRRAKQTLVFRVKSISECRFEYLAANAVHLLMQNVKFGPKLLQIYLFCHAFPRPCNSVDQSQCKQLLKKLKSLLQYVLAFLFLRGALGDCSPLTGHLQHSVIIRKQLFIRHLGVTNFALHFLSFLTLACIFIMLSTIFQSEIYLGFLGESKLQEKSYEQSFLGGRPIFLRKPRVDQLECTVCLKQRLTFICQIFCPLDGSQSYNRVLYVLYCERCERVFRCIKQQTAKGEPIEEVDAPVRVISEDSFEVESSGFQIKELQKIIKRAKVEVQDQVIQEKQQEEFQDEEGEVDMKEINAETIEKMGFTKYTEEDKELSKEELESLKHASELQGEKEEKDLVFEEYKKVMKELEGPVLMYSNIPIPYNNQVINPKHFCKACNSKLSPELQLTEKLLLLNQKLLRLDWGSLMVFTCSNSCQQSDEECVVVQYEIDAIKDSQVSALRKRQKNKKRKQQKEKSKDKRKQEGSKEKFKQESKPQSKEQDNDDWD